VWGIKGLRTRKFSERLGKVMRWRRDVRFFNRPSVYVVLIVLLV